MLGVTDSTSDWIPQNPFRLNVSRLLVTFHYWLKMILS